jgi:hypothetical protein
MIEMKKWYFIISLLQIILGLAAITIYILLAIEGEPVGKWTITLLLAVGYIVLGIFGIINLKKSD